MDYPLHLLIIITIFGILAVSLNYKAGFAGIISVHHASFYGIGAYATAILTTKYGFTFIPSVLLGMALTALIAWLASYPILRLRHDSLILVSIGFSAILYNLMLNLMDLTGGPLGIKGIRAPSIFGFSFFEKPLFLVLVLIALVITYFFFRHITCSPYGTIIKGIRENPTVAGVNGHAVANYQRSVFVTSAVCASVAGSFMATFLTYIEPKLFDLNASILILVMVILGGMGNLKGSVVGAAIIILIPEFLRFAGFPDSLIGELQQITYGLILIVLMFFRPEGLFGEYKI